MDIKRILLDAADLIEAHGLAKGQYVDDEGRYCTVGAIRMAASGHIGGDELPVLTHLASRVDPENIDPERALVDWNDHGDHTAEEVVEALRLAAANVPE